MNYKTAIIPIISVVCLAIAGITGHNVDASTQDMIAQIGGIVIGAIAGIWGIYKNHKEDKK